MNKIYSIDELQKLIVDQIGKEANTIGKTEPLNLYQPISYTLNMGGKRLRPMMVLLACQLFGQDVEKAIPAALAVEIFHNFTLLHDDIMDHADIRRNQPSVHKRYNENVAILSGDAMSIMANQYLLKTETPAIHPLVQLFSQTAIEVCEGQQYDMDFEDSQLVNISDYMEMIRLKTAVLIGCSLKMGAIIANAPTSDADHIYQFGINLGIAFQLQDDLLDVFADQEKFGKKNGGDITANKKTFLLLKALELASPLQKDELIGWIEKKNFDSEEKITAIKQIYLDLGLPQISRNLMESYYQKSLNALKYIDLKKEKKEILLTLARMIMQRQH